MNLVRQIYIKDQVNLILSNASSVSGQHCSKNLSEYWQTFTNSVNNLVLSMTDHYLLTSSNYNGRYNLSFYLTFRLAELKELLQVFAWFKCNLTRASGEWSPSMYAFAYMIQRPRRQQLYEKHIIAKVLVSLLMVLLFKSLIVFAVPLSKAGEKTWCYHCYPPQRPQPSTHVVGSASLNTSKNYPENRKCNYVDIYQ